MIRHFLAASAALALAACGGSDRADGNAADADGEAAKTESASAERVEIEPGQWEMKMEMAGMPAEMAEAMKAIGQSGAITSLVCITPEEAKANKGEIFSGKKEENCTYSDVSMGGGKFRAKMACTGGEAGEPASAEIAGEYSPTSWEMRQKAKMVGGAEFDMKVTGRRVGDCPAEAEG